MDLEKATAADAAEILALYRSVVGQRGCPWDEEYPSGETIRFDLAADSLYVMRESGAIIAAASLIVHDDLDEAPLDWPQGRSISMGRICVAPQRQRSGLGAEMVRLMLDEAGARGCVWLRLLVERQNHTAWRLYERMGFQPVGEVDLYGHHYTAMHRAITGEALK